jgi:hypothetical protein
VYGSTEEGPSDAPGDAVINADINFNDDLERGEKSEAVP